MKTTGMLFQADMVRAILEERKTLTSRLRGLDQLNDGYYLDRINKVECQDGVWCFWEIGHGSSALPFLMAKCPYGGAGDRLIGRETWKTNEGYDQCAPSTIDSGARVLFMADESIYRLGRPFNGSPPQWGKTRPAIHLPFKFARLRLEITRVWPSRLQDMTEEMANQEGCPSHLSVQTLSPALADYAELWDRINGEKPDQRWADNPWCWRIMFRVFREAEDFGRCQNPAWPEPSTPGDRRHHPEDHAGRETARDSAFVI